MVQNLPGLDRMRLRCLFSGQTEKHLLELSFRIRPEPETRES
jgi:hypothetical protein